MGRSSFFLFLFLKVKLSWTGLATFRSSHVWSYSSIVRFFFFPSHHRCSLGVFKNKNSLASYLPPSTTIRKYHRRLISTTSVQLGTVYCAVLSFASTKSEPEIQEIISCLLAIRAKLKHSLVIRGNIDYEV
jgi:hypothetical protein